MIYNTTDVIKDGINVGTGEYIVEPQPRLDIPNTFPNKGDKNDMLAGVWSIAYWNDYLQYINSRCHSIVIDPMEVYSYLVSREFKANIAGKPRSDKPLVLHIDIPLDNNIHAGDVLLTFTDGKARPLTISRIKALIKYNSHKPNVMRLIGDNRYVVGPA